MLFIQDTKKPFRLTGLERRRALAAHLAILFPHDGHGVPLPRSQAHLSVGAESAVHRGRDLLIAFFLQGTDFRESC